MKSAWTSPMAPAARAVPASTATSSAAVSAAAGIRRRPVRSLSFMCSTSILSAGEA